jgi:hypothetical protein
VQAACEVAGHTSGYIIRGSTDATDHWSDGYVWLMYLCISCDHYFLCVIQCTDMEHVKHKMQFLVLYNVYARRFQTDLELCECDVST